MVSGSLLLCEVLDSQALAGWQSQLPRFSTEAQSLVIIDHLGAGHGQIVAVSESAEAAAPFYPKQVPVDGTCAAILDHLNYHDLA